MANDEALTALLKQLDSIANAPMTAAQREMRAAPLVAAGRVTVTDVVTALGRADLRWTLEKAQECGVSVETWLAAVQAVGASPTDSLPELLGPIPRPEA